MPRSPFFVIADDLTGAAELAALAHQAGLRAVVLTELPHRRVDAEVVVCDSDSRLDSPTVAARKVGQLARRLRALPHAGIFKKVDSVLRGNVMAEIEAAQTALGLARTLLVPCNPSLGRIIDGGRYSIAGQPLDRTAFRRDPHHPRRSSLVRTLLPGIEGCFDHTEHLPSHGISVGEASSPADVALWASRLDADTLAAGGADFFRMWLVHLHASRRHSVVPAKFTGPTLLLSGTATPTTPATPLTGPVLQLVPGALGSARALATQVKTQLRAAGAASVLVHRAPIAGKATATALNRTFAQLTRELARHRAFRHALITGGTTASSVLSTLGWRRLEVVHVWGPGVVTLRPQSSPRVLVTMKPGSYPWPVSLRRHFAAA